MFPQSKRLARDRFPTALAGGQRLSSKHFSAVAPKGVQGYAVVVSKKVARLSTTRHRLKRRVVAALQTLSLPSALIIFPKASAGQLSPAELRVELAALLAPRSR